MVCVCRVCAASFPKEDLLNYTHFPVVLIADISASLSRLRLRPNTEASGLSCLERCRSTFYVHKNEMREIAQCVPGPLSDPAQHTQFKIYLNAARETLYTTLKQ